MALVADPVAVPRTEETTEQVVALWLHGRSPHTQRAYRADVERFLRFCGKPLPAVTLADLQAWADHLEDQGLAPASRARALSAVKSLLAWAHRAGLLPVNVGAALRLPAVRQRLAERILPEEAVQRMLALATNPRDQALLRLLYGGGLRISEAIGLCWRDLQPREDGRGQVTVWGKGEKERTVVVSATTWAALQALRRPGDGPDDPVFRSRKGGRLSPAQAWRIVRKAAKRAGVELPVSPHFLRHAHASHALERGAPIHLVQATLGHASVATTGRYLHARPEDSSSRYVVA
jgi:integrase/recombinase XerD